MPLNLQPLRLVDKIRGCKLLEDDTDLRLKHIKDYPLDLTNADTLRSSLKGEEMHSTQ